MHIALDIDGTITRQPAFFALLARAVRAAGDKVFVVTSRMDTDEVRRKTRGELKDCGVDFDELFIIPHVAGQMLPCPHGELDAYQKYLWQKAAVCLDQGVSILFEDDAKVIALFRAYAPGIQVFQVVQPMERPPVRSGDESLLKVYERLCRSEPQP